MNMQPGAISFASRSRRLSERALDYEVSSKAFIDNDWLSKGNIMVLKNSCNEN